MTDMSTKWGMVIVYDAAGTIKRKFVITAAIAERVHARLSITAQHPVLAALWATGRVAVESRPCNAGQCVANPDGTLMVNTGIDTSVTDAVTVTVTAVPQGLWSYDGTTVFLDDTVIRQLGL